MSVHLRRGARISRPIARVGSEKKASSKRGRRDIRIIVAQCTIGGRPDLEQHVQSLLAALEAAEHKTQRLDLPVISSTEQVFSTIASYRLIATSHWADALICLDPVASVLSSQRKFVWLLDSTFLDADDGKSSQLGDGTAAYLANVVRAGIREADLAFAPSRYALQALKATGCSDFKLLQPGNWAPLLKALKQ